MRSLGRKKSERPTSAVGACARLPELSASLLVAVRSATGACVVDSLRRLCTVFAVASLHHAARACAVPDGGRPELQSRRPVCGQDSASGPQALPAGQVLCARGASAGATPCWAPRLACLHPPLASSCCVERVCSMRRSETARNTHIGGTALAHVECVCRSYETR